MYTNPPLAPDVVAGAGAVSANLLSYRNFYNDIGGALGQINLWFDSVNVNSGISQGSYEALFLLCIRAGAGTNTSVRQVLVNGSEATNIKQGIQDTLNSSAWHIELAEGTSSAIVSVSMAASGDARHGTMSSWVVHSPNLTPSFIAAATSGTSGASNNHMLTQAIPASAEAAYQTNIFGNVSIAASATWGGATLQEDWSGNGAVLTTAKVSASGVTRASHDVSCAFGQTMSGTVESQIIGVVVSGG